MNQMHANQASPRPENRPKTHLHLSPGFLRKLLKHRANESQSDPKRREKNQPNTRRAFSFHFGTFTPFTMSHRQSDNSPIKASIRMRKIVPAYAGARMSVKLFTR